MTENNVKSLEAPVAFTQLYRRYTVQSCHNISHVFIATCGKNSVLNEKSAKRDANTARALAVVRFGHRPPARPLSQTHRQDRLQYTAPQLASAQCNNKNSAIPFQDIACI